MKKDKDAKLIKCPLCSSLSYMKKEGETLICKSCKTDLIPYIDAYAEYARIRGEQKNEEETARSATPG